MKKLFLYCKPAGLLISGLVITTMLLSGCGSAVANSTSVGQSSTLVKTTQNSANNNISVSAIPSTISIKSGDNFDVTISVNTSRPTRGVQFVLTWDAAKVQCNSTEQGNYFTSFAKVNGGDVYYFPSNNPEVDNKLGRFPSSGPNIAIALTGALGPDNAGLGVTGKGDVFILHMTAKNGVSGVLNFKLSNIFLGDIDGNDLKALVNNGQVTISQ